MKAMILAAGFGTRLKPLTNKIPKALIEINGIPLLELVIKKLIATGVKEVIINTHHFADQVESFLKKRNNFGIHIELSHEPEILGTGGGLQKAACFFDENKPFFLHNVDILSTINLTQMYQYHLNNHSIVTLAVKQRKTSRYFIMDEKNRICGHEDISNQLTRMRRTPQGKTKLMAFCGIHVISPSIFNYMKQCGNFSIVDVYLNLIEKGLTVSGFQADEFYWKDVGKLEALNEIHQDVENKIITLI